MFSQRDFTVTALALKGKAKTPTVSLESRDGEKLTLKLEDSLQLAYFGINREFTIKLSDGEQTKFPVLEPVVSPLPIQQGPLAVEVLEASATIPEGECPKGVGANEYGTSEVCDDCTHLVREGDPELGMGAVVCDLDSKLKEEQHTENV